MTISNINNFMGGTLCEGLVTPTQYRVANFTGLVPTGVAVSQNTAPIIAVTVPAAAANGVVVAGNILSTGNLTLNTVETTDCITTTVNPYNLGVATVRAIKTVPRTVILAGNIQLNNATTYTYTFTVNGFDQYFQKLTSVTSFTSPLGTTIVPIRLETPSAFSYISSVNITIPAGGPISSGSVITGDSSGSKIGMPYRMVNVSRYTNIYYNNTVLTPTLVVTPGLNPAASPASTTGDVRGLVTIPDAGGNALVVYGWVEGAAGTNGTDPTQVAALFGRVPFYS